MVRTQKRILTAIVTLLVMLCLLVPAAKAQQSALSNALFLVTNDTPQSQLAIFPVDSVSLQDMTSYAPLPMGDHYIVAFSPDRTTLASIVWPDSMDRAKGVLHLVDLTTWEDHVTGATFEHYVVALNFSADGEKLYWVQSTTIGMHETFSVLYCRVSSCDTAIPLLELPERFEPHQVRLLLTSPQMAVFGFPTDTGHFSMDIPQVLIIDLEMGQITATINLDGLIAGQRQLPPLGDEQMMRFESNVPGLAWNLSANLLYIAHPTTSELTIVDLAEGTIAQHVNLSGDKKQPERTKLANGIERLSVMNEATGRLYVSTLQRDTTFESDEEFSMMVHPLGIQMIDTHDMTVVEEITLPLYEMTLSPDGRYLLATGTESIYDQEGSGTTSYSGLYILDAQTLQTLKHIEADKETVFLMGFSENSRYAYASFLEYGAHTSVLRVIDLATQEVAAERVIEYISLLGTVNTMP